ncbi:glutathione S-transferase family protein [Defluviimonas sp. WL0024]|uniref:Glutathione S-transferase family protein n=2 Tax=Albidovulum TaxID=205889 RepID=A0ABT3IZS2_9RHOB|nr:glutathione S-transferase family protein [Defluviimonas sp. WL0024]MCU9847133.1 glutathione S-transferase family protein [Defluviimonas sp. WL0024]MCW3780933.1 glutathione S-transferase family protein [Defluviimonas salinarum]
MIRLHHCHQTRSMRSLWLLNELDLKFHVVLHPFDRSLRSLDYLSVNPAGRVPALEIDERVIWESGAITEYLCERFPEPELGRAPGDPERIDWLIWVHFAETISQHTAALTQQHIALYDDAMRSPVVMRIEAKRLEKCYGALERRLLGRTHLLDRGFSAADIGVGQALYMARHFARLEAFPTLAAWYDRVTARPAFKKALPPKRAELLYKRDFYEAWDG